MKKLLVLILAVLMIVSSFILTGCNDNGDIVSPTEPPEKVPITRKVTMYEVDESSLNVGNKVEREITYKGVIKIGNTNSSSGDVLDYTEGIKAYINNVNFNGGIGGDYDEGKQGYFIEFVNYDDRDNPTTGYDYTKKLVEEDNVFAIVGQFSEKTVDATLGYIKENGVIFVGPACGNSEMFSTEAYLEKSGVTIFPVRPIDMIEGRYTDKYIYDLYPDVRKIGIVFADDGEGFKDGVQAQWEILGQSYECVVVEATEKFKFDTEKLSDCDVIVIATGKDGTQSVIEVLKSEKIHKPVFTSDSIANELLSNSEWKPEGIGSDYEFPLYVNNWFTPTDLNEYFEFVLDFVGTYGSLDKINNCYAMEGWIVADVFCEGLRRIAGISMNFTTDKFIEAMESDKIEIAMTSSVTGEAKLDYMYGYRTSSLTIGLLKFNDDCTAYEEIFPLKELRVWASGEE